MFQPRRGDGEVISISDFFCAWYAGSHGQVPLSSGVAFLPKFHGGARSWDGILASDNPSTP